jgi:hypothetical protein
MGHCTKVVDSLHSQIGREGPRAPAKLLVDVAQEIIYSHLPSLLSMRDDTSPHHHEPWLSDEQ